MSFYRLDIIDKSKPRNLQHYTVFTDEIPAVDDYILFHGFKLRITSCRQTFTAHKKDSHGNYRGIPTKNLEVEALRVT